MLWASHRASLQRICHLLTYCERPWAEDGSDLTIIGLPPGADRHNTVDSVDWVAYWLYCARGRPNPPPGLHTGRGRIAGGAAASCLRRANHGRSSVGCHLRKFNTIQDMHGMHTCSVSSYRYEDNEKNSQATGETQDSGVEFGALAFALL